jgi:NADPH:quinone reductase-like Zn-dependent oxidoreductase
VTKTVRFHQTGDPDVLRIEDQELRAPSNGEIALKVHAVGLNRAESMFRRGRYLEPPKLPSGLGYEASGTIEKLGPGVEGFAVGDAVSVIPSFSMNEYPVCAERAIVPSRALVAKPEHLSWIQAASVWMQYMTAWGALVQVADLRRGDFVIVTAASSSVGLAAIQIVNALGATPIALTRTSGKRSALEKAGAKHVIASSEQDLVAEIARITGGRGARVAFDPIAGPGIETLAQAMSVGGIVMLYGALSGEPTPYPLFVALEKRLTLRGYVLFEIVEDPQRFAAGKRYILDGLKTGLLTPIIAKTFPLDQIVAAYTYLESNQQIGKVAVTVP